MIRALATRMDRSHAMSIMGAALVALAARMAKPYAATASHGYCTGAGVIPHCSCCNYPANCCSLNCGPNDPACYTPTHCWYVYVPASTGECYLEYRCCDYRDSADGVNFYSCYCSSYIGPVC